MQAAEKDGFDVLLSGDKSLYKEQNLPAGTPGNCGDVVSRMAIFRENRPQSISW